MKRFVRWLRREARAMYRLRISDLSTAVIIIGSH